MPRGRFWLCYFAALLALLVFLLGCARVLRPLTPADGERLRCRAMAERICGTHPASGYCRGTAYRECAALQLRAARACAGVEE